MRVVDKQQGFFAVHFQAHGDPFVERYRGAGFVSAGKFFAQPFKFVFGVGIILRRSVPEGLVVGAADFGIK